MHEHIEQLQALTTGLRDVIRKDKGEHKDLPKYRRTERANLHHRLMLLVPVVKDTRIYLSQLKTCQSTEDSRCAPDRLVSVLLSLFATGKVFVPETHDLWQIPLPAALVEAHCNRYYEYPFQQSFYRANDKFNQFCKQHATGLSLLGDYRALFLEHDLSAQNSSQTRKMKELSTALALKTRLKMLLKPEEFDLLRRYQKAVFAVN
jgi:hypothetical protein